LRAWHDTRVTIECVAVNIASTPVAVRSWRAYNYRVASTRSDRADDALLAVVGAMAMLVAAGSLVTVRSTIGTTNVALILLALVTTLGWLGGRLAGAGAAIMAALSFNFFHTEPYRTLRIDAAADVLTVALLMVMGLVAGTLTELRRRRARESEAERGELHRLTTVIERLRSASNLGELVDTATAAVLRELSLQECTFERTRPDRSYPVLDWRGGLPSGEHVTMAGRFELPAEGVAVPVTHQVVAYGVMVLRPTPQEPIDDGQRRFAVAVANVLGCELAARGVGTGPDAE
jgi:K+-sensing histidine kinase KdpD